MPQTTYRVNNWRDYNQALIQRGSLTVWISDEAIGAWTYGAPIRPTQTLP